MGLRHRIFMNLKDGLSIKFNVYKKNIFIKTSNSLHSHNKFEVFILYVKIFID